MQASIDLHNALTVTLQEAVLVYRASNGERGYATHHKVFAATNPFEQPILGPAKPLTTNFLAALNDSLGKGIDLEVLPENVLVRTLDTIAWWTPAQHRPMFFAGSRVEGVSKQLNGKVYPHPALVFVAYGGQLYVRALFENKRPTAETLLFVAPYWNVNESGNVCQGSMDRPGSRSIKAIEEWERSFFVSEFTHANTTSITSFPAGYLDLCLTLAGSDDPFSTGLLLDAKQTLSNFIKRCK